MQVLFIKNNPRRRADIYHHDLNFDFSSPADALDRIEKYQRPDAVVADYNLDESEIRKLRKITDHSDVPLILYTQNFDQDAKNLALILGIDDYFDDATLPLFESKVRLIKEVRKCNIQWLQYEHDSQHGNETALDKWQLFKVGMSRAVSSSAMVATGFWRKLVIAMSEEIRSMQHHTCSASKNKCLLGRIVGWYELAVLILFSPIFLIIKMPLKIKLNHFSWSKFLGLEDNKVARLTSLLGLGHGK